jgi:drug/metabolite transporter (DMT)-like permease
MIGAEAQSRPVARYAPELAALAVAFLWASTFIVTKDAFESFRPLAFVGVRFVLMTILAAAVLYARGRHDPQRYFVVDRADWGRFLFVGLVGYGVYQLGFNFGLDRSSAFAASLIMAMTPLFALLIGTIQGERPTLTVWLGVGVAIAGVVIFLLDKDSGGTILGTILVLVASVSSAIYSVVNRPLVRKYPFETVAAITTTAGAIPLILVAIPDLVRQDWGGPTAMNWVALVYMVILPVYVAYILWNWAISQRGLSITGAQLLVPIFSGALSAIILSESFGPLKVIGGSIALVGLLLMRYRPRRITNPASVTL